MTPVGRRLLRPSEIRALLGPPDRGLSRQQRRLSRCADLTDLRELARRRVPAPVFDYVDGAAGSEVSLLRARDVFDRVEFTPRVLRDVDDVDTSTTLLGRRASLPIVLAPTGFTRMMHHDGELAVVRAAREHGLPYTLSTMSTVSMDDLAAAEPKARRWYQLYVWRDRRAAERMVRQAWDLGYDTLMITVDAPVGGLRQRDVRNGFTVPPHVSLRTVAQLARSPRWWMNVVTTPPLQFAALAGLPGSVSDSFSLLFDPRLTYADIASFRKLWPGALVVKGVQCIEDARAVADLGVDGIVLSNHGGRQLDMANVPLELLPEVVHELGDRVEILVDGGIMRGTDVIAALALGARGVLVGRAYLYGLMAGGHDGVVRALDILEQEVRTTMQLVGAVRVDDLRAVEVRLRRRSE